MSKVTEYLATIILPSLLVDEVENVLHLEKESIKKINDDMRNIKHKISKKNWNDKWFKEFEIPPELERFGVNIDSYISFWEMASYINSHLGLHLFLKKNNWDKKYLAELGYIMEV